MIRCCAGRVSDRRSLKSRRGHNGDTVVNFGANDVRTVGGASTVGNTKGYTGQTDDRETGLMYYKNRYMSTALGKFISRDPIGYTGGINLYRYVENSPSRYVDLEGYGPNDLPRADNHEFVSVADEKAQNLYDQTCSVKCKPISIVMSMAGTAPTVGRRRRPRPGGPIDPNPWLGTGINHPNVGVVSNTNTFAAMNLEWIISFNTNPRKCKWGRNVARDWHVTEKGWAYFTPDEWKSVHDDTDDSGDFIIGNQVFMYDRPAAGLFRSNEFLFEVWAKSEDGKISISNWYYVMDDN